MSATEQMRAMLDGLMGTARDGNDSKNKHLHFADHRVCRAFLLDCCPHDIFASTKLELGKCSKVHDHALRADYIKANRLEDCMFETSALDRLESFIGDADRKTDMLRRKLAETQQELTAEETKKLNRLHELNETLGKKLAQLEQETDDSEARKKLLDETERIKRDRAHAEAEYREVSRPASSHQQQNLRVCDVCSAYLGINDNDSRLADHYGGKLHLGFIAIREKLEELRKLVASKLKTSKRGQLPKEQTRSTSNRDRDRDRERDIDRERERDRDRDRERERERERDRERDRPRDYDYDYDYDRNSQPRSRYRGYERERSYQRETRDYYPYRSRDHGYDRPRSRGSHERLDGYQRRLREWEKREAEKAIAYEKRLKEERDKKLLEEQESRKLKEFLEDYKDDRDDQRFYRGSALTRRLVARRKEIEEDEFIRQKEKDKLESLRLSCTSQVVEQKSNEDEAIPETNNNSTAIDQHSGTTTTTTTTTAGLAANETTGDDNNSTKPSSNSSSNNPPKEKVLSSESKRKHFEELISRIPTDKEQLFARELDWSLLDENLMEKRIRPWVTKKIAEYMGEKEVDLIDFVCHLLNAHSDGNSMLREVAVVLDDEAEKFVVHMWRLLIFELEAKKSGLRK